MQKTHTYTGIIDDCLDEIDYYSSKYYVVGQSMDKIHPESELYAVEIYYYDEEKDVLAEDYID